MMSILGTIVIGLIVGFIARAIKPGDDKLGWIMTAVWALRVPSWPPMRARPWGCTRPAPPQAG
jgi:hypothetical protein